MGVVRGSCGRKHRCTTVQLPLCGLPVDISAAATHMGAQGGLPAFHPAAAGGRPAARYKALLRSTQGRAEHAADVDRPRQRRSGEPARQLHAIGKSSACFPSPPCNILVTRNAGKQARHRPMEVEAGREEVGRRDGLPLPPASLLPPQLLLPPREGLARELATPRPRLGLARLAQPLGPAVPLPCTSRRRAISSAFSATCGGGWRQPTASPPRAPPAAGPPTAAAWPSACSTGVAVAGRGCRAHVDVGTTHSGSGTPDQQATGNHLGVAGGGLCHSTLHNAPALTAEQPHPPQPVRRRRPQRPHRQCCIQCPLPCCFRRRRHGTGTAA